MKHRSEYSWILGATITAFIGVLLVVAFSGQYSGCRTSLLPASELSSLRDCARIDAFYFGGWTLLGLASVAAALGARAIVQRRRAVSESS